MTVVRLKEGLRPDQPKEHFGTRTDYRCARSLVYSPDWHFADPPHWMRFYRQYSDKKPSTGLCAVFCAIDALNPQSIAVIGFDRVVNPQNVSRKWYERDAPQMWDHDQTAENKALNALGIEIIDLGAYGNLP